MRDLLIVVVVLLLGLLLIDALNASGAELPSTIKTCVTDDECEKAARILCAAGHKKWCLELPKR